MIDVLSSQMLHVILLFDRDYSVGIAYDSHQDPKSQLRLSPYPHPYLSATSFFSHHPPDVYPNRGVYYPSFVFIRPYFWC